MLRRLHLDNRVADPVDTLIAYLRGPVWDGHGRVVVIAEDPFIDEIRRRLELSGTHGVIRLAADDRTWSIHGARPAQLCEDGGKAGDWTIVDHLGLPGSYGKSSICPHCPHSEECDYYRQTERGKAAQLTIHRRARLSMDPELIEELKAEHTEMVILGSRLIRNRRTTIVLHREDLRRCLACVGSDKWLAEQLIATPAWGFLRQLLQPDGWTRETVESITLPERFVPLRENYMLHQRLLDQHRTKGLKLVLGGDTISLLEELAGLPVENRHFGIRDDRIADAIADRARASRKAGKEPEDPADYNIIWWNRALCIPDDVTVDIRVIAPRLDHRYLGIVFKRDPELTSEADSSSPPVLGCCWKMAVPPRPRHVTWMQCRSEGRTDGPETADESGWEQYLSGIINKAHDWVSGIQKSVLFLLPAQLVDVDYHSHGPQAPTVREQQNDEAWKTITTYIQREITALGHDIDDPPDIRYHVFRPGDRQPFPGGVPDTERPIADVVFAYYDYSLTAQQLCSFAAVFGLWSRRWSWKAAELEAGGNADLGEVIIRPTHILQPLYEAADALQGYDRDRKTVIMVQDHHGQFVGCDDLPALRHAAQIHVRDAYRSMMARERFFQAATPAEHWTITGARAQDAYARHTGLVAGRSASAERVRTLQSGKLQSLIRGVFKSLAQRRLLKTPRISDAPLAALVDVKVDQRAANLRSLVSAGWEDIQQIRLTEVTTNTKVKNSPWYENIESGYTEQNGSAVRAYPGPELAKLIMSTAGKVVWVTTDARTLLHVLLSDETNRFSDLRRVLLWDLGHVEACLQLGSWQVKDDSQASRQKRAELTNATSACKRRGIDTANIEKNPGTPYLQLFRQQWRDARAQGLLDTLLDVELPSLITHAIMERHPIHIDIGMLERLDALTRRAEDRVYQEARQGNVLTKGISLEDRPTCYLPETDCTYDFLTHHILTHLPRFAPAVGWPADVPLHAAEHRMITEKEPLLATGDDPLVVSFWALCTLRRLRSPLGRIGVWKPPLHVTHTPTAQATGRSSPANPAINTLAYPLRPLVPANSDRVLIEIDAAQFDIALVAALSGDPQLIADYQAGDVYAALMDLAGDAERLTRTDYKIFLLQLLYGAGDHRLAAALEALSDKEGQPDLTKVNVIRDMLRERYPVLFAYLDARRTDNSPVIPIVGGYQRVAPDSGTLSPAARINTPIQGAGAVVFKQAIINTLIALDDLDATVAFHAHDALFIECVEHVYKEAAHRTQHAFADAFSQIMQPPKGLTLRTTVFGPMRQWRKDGYSGPAIGQILDDLELRLSEGEQTLPERYAAFVTRTDDDRPVSRNNQMRTPE